MSLVEGFRYLTTLPYGGVDIPERIVCAANQYGNVILCGIRHGSEDMYSLWDKVEEYDSCFFDYWKEHEQGFITNKGRFVDRKEAWKIALEQRQIVRLVGSQSIDSAFEDTELFSENLY